MSGISYVDYQVFKKNMGNIKETIFATVSMLWFIEMVLILAVWSTQLNESVAGYCLILGHLCPCFSHHNWPSMKFLVGCILSDPVHEHPCDFPLSLLSWNSCCHHAHVNVCSSQTRWGWCFGGLQEPSFPLFLWVGCQGGKQAPKIRTSLSALLFTRLTRFLPLTLLTGWIEWSPLWFLTDILYLSSSPPSVLMVFVGQCLTFQTLSMYNFVQCFSVNNFNSYLDIHIIYSEISVLTIINTYLLLLLYFTHDTNTSFDGFFHFRTLQ